VWEYFEHKVLVAHFPASLEELRARIPEVIADIIHRIWDEISYRWTSAV
jgi:hypothetical protein